MEKPVFTKKKIISAAVVVLVIVLIIVLAVKLCIPMVKMADEPEAFRESMNEQGAKGIALFLFATAIQVVAAVIPAGPLEVAAGYCFGAFQGALIADLGMTLGSLFIFFFVKKFGMDFVEIFIPRKKIESLKFLKTSGQSRLVLFLLFLIPGTPKDVLSYGVGLTDLRLPAWLFITAVGRFPTILLTAMSGDALLGQRYDILIVVIVVIVVTGIVGTILYRKWMKKKGDGNPEQSGEDQTA